MKNWKTVYEIAKAYDLHELSLSTQEETITVRRGAKVIAPGLLPSQESLKTEAPSTGHFKKVVSPLAGVFYRAPAPGAEPFVNEGEKIQIGDALCIIEAMKVLNEITSEANGIISKIVPNNADAVNEGDILFLIEPEPST